MPVHRVPTIDLEATVAAIEAKERIVAVESAGPGALLVFTEARRQAPGSKETRA